MLALRDSEHKYNYKYMIIMETTSVCTVRYLSYVRCGPNLRTNRFCLLFPKSVPWRSVHKTVYCIVITLST